MAFLKSHKTTQHFSTIIHTQRDKERERKRLLRPYQEESTTSRLISEVKPVRAWFEQGLETTWEHQVLSSLFLFLPLFSTRFCITPLFFLSSSLFHQPLLSPSLLSPHTLCFFLGDGGGREGQKEKSREDGAQQGSVLESANHHPFPLLCPPHTHRGERESGDGLVGVVGV